MITREIMAENNEATTDKGEVVLGSTPRIVADMRHDLNRINELVDSIERLSTARRKIDPIEFSELRERIGNLPLPKA